jgi:hypothetical protein
MNVSTLKTAIDDAAKLHARLSGILAEISPDASVHRQLGRRAAEFVTMAEARKLFKTDGIDNWNAFAALKRTGNPRYRCVPSNPPHVWPNWPGTKAFFYMTPEQLAELDANPNNNI